MTKAFWKKRSMPPRHGTRGSVGEAYPVGSFHGQLETPDGVVNGADAFDALVYELNPCVYLCDALVSTGATPAEPMAP